MSMNAVAPVRRAKLPKDAMVQIQTYPRELYINMTITKPEHLQALYDTLQVFAGMMGENE